MEDVDFIFEAVRVTDQRSVGVYGVLDGHGGKECGMFISLLSPTPFSANTLISFYT